MVDECILFDEDCNLNLLDADEEEEFLSHDIANAFEEQRQTLQQCLTTEFISKTMSEIFTDETSFESFDDFDFEKLANELKMKTIDHSNNVENFSPQFSASPPSIQSPQILSFDIPNPTEIYGFDQKQNEMVTSLPLPELGNTHFPTQILKVSLKNQNLETKTSQPKRPRAHGLDHIMAERKRRENISKSFTALAALVPGLKK
ncbi:transcription factor bHLH25-like protein, partial [Trifolium pratense]